MTLHLYGARCGYRCGNAGDEVGRLVVASLSGRPVDYAGICAADLVACGSIAQDLPTDWIGWAWGTGLMFEERRVLTTARVAAVRGPLTACRWPGVGSKPMGDPGLLAAEVLGVERAAAPRYRIGFVPHYVDADSWAVTEWCRRWPDVATVIDICQPPRDVLRDISECGVVISSSLHGLVFADALGVPSAWVVLSDKVNGAGFKFRDYYASLGNWDPRSTPFAPETEPDALEAACIAHDVTALKADLRASFPKELCL